VRTNVEPRTSNIELRTFEPALTQPTNPPPFSRLSQQPDKPIDSTRDVSGRIFDWLLRDP